MFTVILKGVAMTVSFLALINCCYPCYSAKSNMFFLLLFSFAGFLTNRIFQCEITVISLYFVGLAMLFYLFKRTEAIHDSILWTVSALFWQRLLIALIGSIVTPLLNNSLSYPLYSVISCILIVAPSLLARNYKDIICPRYVNIKSIRLDIAYKTTFILIFDLVLPILSIEDHHLFSYRIITMVFIALAVLFVILSRYISTFETEVNNSRLEKENLAAQIAKRQALSEEFSALKHGFMKLYEGILYYIIDDNMNGLKAYYNNFITPINEKYIKEQADVKYLEQIKSGVLKTSLLAAINKASLYKQLDFILNIETAVNKINLDELSLHQIVSNFIQNAFEEVSLQTRGYIAITIHKTENVFVFIIANSICGADSINKPDNSHSGLMLVRKIVEANGHVKLSTNKRINVFEQMLEIEDV